MNHRHDGQVDDGAGPMGHGEGVKGIALMILCCLPMIAIFALVIVGVLR